MSDNSAEQPATRADLYRVAAFLRELDRMLHPASARPAGGYRLPPAVLPPLPPTGSPASESTARQGGSSWMPTRSAPPPPALAPPDIGWVEPPAALAAVPRPGPTPIADTVPDTPLDLTPLPQLPRIATAEPTPSLPPVGAYPEPVAAPSVAEPVTPSAPPAPTLRDVADAAAFATPVAPEPAARRQEPVAVTDHSVPTAALRSPVTPTDPQPPSVPERPPVEPQEPPRPKPFTPPVGTQPVGHPNPVPDRAAPVATATSPARSDEPVELIVDGIDTDDPPTPPEAGPAAPPETDDVLPDVLPDDVSIAPSAPPLPAGRGPRRPLRQLPAATPGPLQAELRRRYLDRTLRSR